MVPAVFALYVLLTRPWQLGYFAIPLLAMGLLAIPWGPEILAELRPWLPGSGGSEISWMYAASDWGT